MPMLAPVLLAPVLLGLALLVPVPGSQGGAAPVVPSLPTLQQIPRSDWASVNRGWPREIISPRRLGR
jgi:hypothetical protein